MWWYSIEPRTRKYVKGYDFYHLQENMKTVNAKELDAVKTVSKKVVHKAGEFIRNNMADAVTKSNSNKLEKQEPAEDLIIPSAKRDEILNKLRKVL